MINWMYFPQNRQVEPHLVEIIEVFSKVESSIDSEVYSGDQNLKSDTVLEIVSPGLEEIGFRVEKSKKAEHKIRVPVLYGLNGKVDLAFEVDAYSELTQTVIEVEAGRAVVNYQFLKDLYESCMMQGVSFLCLAVKNIYKNSKDFQKVCTFLETLYISNRIQIPLSGILVIGY